MASSNMYIPIAFKSDPRGLKKAESDLEKFKKVVKGVAVAAAASIAAMGAGMVAFGIEAVKAADESRQIARGLANAAKNAKVFGTTDKEIAKVTDELTNQSAELSALTGVDDEYIDSLKRGWLTVPNIVRLGTKGINNLATIALDVAAQAGKDSEGVATAISRAFSDPQGAIKKLQKAGAYLTDEQKKRYEQLLKQNGVIKAQNYLIDQLGVRYKGAAQAAASPIQRMQTIWENFVENAGDPFLPILDNSLSKIAKGLNDLSVNPRFQKALADMGNMLAVYIPKALQWLVDNMPRLTQIMSTLADAITRIADVLFPDQQKQAAALKNVNFGKMDKLNVGQGAYMTYNININASSVDTSANTGKAIANALNNYLRSGGSVNTRGPLKTGYRW